MKVMYEDKEIGKMRFCEPYSCMEPILDLLETKNYLEIRIKNMILNLQMQFITMCAERRLI